MYEKISLENNLDTKLNVWSIQKPKAIIQVLHGMGEHIDRYDELAEFMNTKGILVAGHNMRGHGIHYKNDNYGYFAKHNGFEKLVEDAINVTKTLNKKYPGVPIILLGHSMGSIVLRNYLTNGTIEMVKGAVVSGSMDPNRNLLKLFKFITTIILKFKGPRYRSKILNALVFFNHNKKIEDPNTSFDWLTRDQAKVETYIADDLSGGLMPAVFFKDLINGLLSLDKATFKIDVPLLFITGEADPVGNYGEDVRKIIKKYHQHTDVTSKFYSGARHEVLNEKNNKKVYNDIYNWVINLLSR